MTTRLAWPAKWPGSACFARTMRGALDRSLLDTGGAALVVSQFTLIADTQKRNRPVLAAAAAAPEEAEPLVENFCAALRGLGVPVQTGVFGARMEVELRAHRRACDDHPRRRAHGRDAT